MCLKVWDCFFLAHEHFGSLGDIFEACFVFFAQLTKLSTTEEELKACESLAVKSEEITPTLYLSDGWEELKNCLAASEL